MLRAERKALLTGEGGAELKGASMTIHNVDVRAFVA